MAHLSSIDTLVESLREQITSKTLDVELINDRLFPLARITVKENPNAPNNRLRPARARQPINNATLAVVVKQTRRSIIIRMHVNPQRFKAIVASPPSFAQLMNIPAHPRFPDTAHGLVNHHPPESARKVEPGMQSPLPEYSDAVKAFGQDSIGSQNRYNIGNSGSSTPVRFHTPAPWGWHTPPHGPSWSDLGDVQTVQDGGGFDDDDLDLLNNSPQGSCANPTDCDCQTNPGSRYSPHSTIPYLQHSTDEKSPNRRQRSSSISTVSSITSSLIHINLDHPREAEADFSNNVNEEASTVDGSTPRHRIRSSISPTESSFQQPPMNMRKPRPEYTEEEKKWVIHYMKIERDNGITGDLKWVHISKHLTNHGLDRSVSSIKHWWTRYGKQLVVIDKKQPLHQRNSEKKYSRGDVYGEKEQQLILNCVKANAAKGAKATKKYMGHSKWEDVSQELAKHGLRRSAAAIRAWWITRGRKQLGFDERWNRFESKRSKSQHTLPQIQPMLIDTASQSVTNDTPEQTAALAKEAFIKKWERRTETHEGNKALLENLCRFMVLPASVAMVNQKPYREIDQQMELASVFGPPSILGKLLSNFHMWMASENKKPPYYSLPHYLDNLEPSKRIPVLHLWSAAHILDFRVELQDTNKLLWRISLLKYVQELHRTNEAFKGLESTEPGHTTLNENPYAEIFNTLFPAHLEAVPDAEDTNRKARLIEYQRLGAPYLALRQHYKSDGIIAMIPHAFPHSHEPARIQVLLEALDIVKPEIHSNDRLDLYGRILRCMYWGKIPNKKDVEQLEEYSQEDDLTGQPTQPENSGEFAQTVGEEDGQQDAAQTLLHRQELFKESSSHQNSTVRKRNVGEDQEEETDVQDINGDDGQVRAGSTRRAGLRPVRTPKRQRVIDNI
ncbi:MAG: hypothetical protein Q9224_003218 [Gallowayella concinna]